MSLFRWKVPWSLLQQLPVIVKSGPYSAQLWTTWSGTIPTPPIPGFRTPSGLGCSLFSLWVFTGGMFGAVHRKPGISQRCPHGVSLVTACLCVSKSTQWVAWETLLVNSPDLPIDSGAFYAADAFSALYYFRVIPTPAGRSRPSFLELTSPRRS